MNIATLCTMQIQGKQFLAIIRSSAITIYPDDKKPQKQLPIAPAKQLARPYSTPPEISSNSSSVNRFSFSSFADTKNFPLGIYIDIYV